MRIRAWAGVALVVGLLAGCAPKVDVGSATLTTIDSAITKLTDNSADWQRTLRETIGQLPKDAESFVRVELNDLLGRGVAAAGSEIRCVIDFVGRRVLQGLTRVRASLLHQPVPPREPTFCGVNPPLISMADRNTDPNRVQAVHLHGYDFDTDPAMQVLLTDNGAVSDVTGDNLTRQTHYQMVLNIGGNGVRLTPTSQRLSLSWNGRSMVDIPVIQPGIPPCDTRLVNLDNIGTHETRAGLLRGDAEFGTNQPWVSAGITLTNHDSHITASLTIRAEEARGGDTLSAGTSVFNIHSAQSGWRVLRIVTPVSDEVPFYHDKTHEVDVFPRGGDVPVRTFEIWGDTPGDDVEPDRADGTRVVASFRRVVIEEIQTKDCR
jgi:hypothetical protein